MYRWPKLPPSRTLMSFFLFWLVAWSIWAQTEGSLPGGLTPEDIQGSWKGNLVVQGANLPLVFNLSLTTDGLGASLDSPSQGARGIPTSGAKLEGRRLTILLPALKASYTGEVAVNGLEIAGTWTQGQTSLPLKLTRAAQGVRPSPAQDLGPPGAYRTEEVALAGGEPGLVLAGTLSLPQGPGPFPAVLLVSGSGPQDRDETILGHRPFRVLADYLCRRGIAVLRLDDRGVGASTGDFGSATSLDFCKDAEAAINWLSSRPGIDPNKVGIIGHSEGGLIAPIVAARDPAVRFVALLAGPGMPGKDLLLLQTSALLRASGAPEEDIQATRAINARLYAMAAGPGDLGLSAEALKRTYLDWIGQRSGLSESQRGEASQGADALVASLLTPWMRCFLTLDPRPALARLTIPVLALNGGLDLQVPAKENLDAIRAAMEGGRGGARLTTMVLPGLNHLFQHAGSGLPSEYAYIEEDLAPEVLKALGEWILAR